MPYPNAISLPQDGSPGSPSQINDAIRHINYGNTLAPVDLNGQGVDNSLNLGSSNAKWKNLYAGGVVAGNPVGSFTVTERRSARYTLPPKDVAAYLAGEKVFFSIDISPLGKITGIHCALTFVGDDFDFATGTGTIVNNVQNHISYSLNSGYADVLYNTFQIRIVNSTIEIIGLALYSGIYDLYQNYFVINTSNWDGTTKSRGWLDIEYSPL